MGRNSRFQAKIRHFSRSAVTQLPNAARRAARQKRTNKAEGVEEDTALGANRRAQPSPVPHAESRPRYRLNLAATGRYIVRTATVPESAAAAVAAAGGAGEIAGLAVSNSDIRSRDSTMAFCL